MGRKSKPVFLRSDGKLYNVFDSAAEAGCFLGVPAAYVRLCIYRRIKCRGYALSYEPEGDLRDVKIKDERRKPEKTYTAEIEGRTFKTEFIPGFKKCTECDIFKMKPPANMGQVPLCYDYSCDNRKIVNICQSFKVIWRELKNK